MSVFVRRPGEEGLEKRGPEKGNREQRAKNCFLAQTWMTMLCASPRWRPRSSLNRYTDTQMVHLTAVPNVTLVGVLARPSPLGSFRVRAVSRAGTALYARMPGQLFTDTQISSVAYKTPRKNHREGMILPVFVWPVFVGDAR